METRNRKENERNERLTEKIGIVRVEKMLFANKSEQKEKKRE